MANIRVQLDCEIIDGQPVTFVAPCNCTEITGLKVIYPGGAKIFTFKDAHRNALTGIGNLFSKGAYVKAILDVNNDSAYIQNADTNAYLEGMFNENRLSASDPNNDGNIVLNGGFSGAGTGGGSGTPGLDGATFFPHVSASGDLSWTNDSGLENPETVNIMGPKPVKGVDYNTEADKQEIVNLVLYALPNWNGGSY